MRKSFFNLFGAIFLGVLALQGANESVSAGVGLARLACGVEIDQADRSQADLVREDYLRLADRTLMRLFRSGRSAQPEAYQLRFDSEVAVDATRSDNPAGRRVLAVNPDFQKWRQVPAVRQAVLRMMLVAALGLSNEESRHIPHWVLIGLDQEVEALCREDRIYRVGYYPGVRNSVLGGYEIDWVERYVEDPDLTDATGPIAAWYAESCRLMLEMAAHFAGRSGALSDYVIMKARQQGDRAEIFRATIGLAASGRERSLDLDPDQAAAKGMRDFVASRVFSAFQPAPGSETLTRFRALRKVSCLVKNEADKEMEISGDFTELPRWRLRYPETIALPGQLAAQFDLLRSRSSLLVAAEFGEVSSILRSLELRKEEAAVQELAAAADRAEAACVRQERIDRLLDTGEGVPELSGAREVTRWHVFASEQLQTPLSKEIETFVDQAERTYLAR